MSSPFGKWSQDDAGLPCFDLDPEARQDSDAPLDHLMSTGAMTALVNRWGDLRLMTCAGGEGQKALRPSHWYCLSELLLSLQMEGELYSLAPGQCDPGRTARWGIGYACFEGRLTRPTFALQATQEFVAPWDDSTGVIGCFTLQNLGDQRVEMTIRLCAAIAALPTADQAGEAALPYKGGDGWVYAEAMHASLGNAMLLGPDGWTPSREYVTLILAHPCILEPGEAIHFQAWVGCTPGQINPDIAGLWRRVKGFNPGEERRKWAQRLALAKLPAPAEWITEECLWSAGQLLAFTGYDGSRGQKFIHLGGYGWYGFGMRECAETALAMAPWAGGLSRESLCWLAKNQWPSGDLPKVYNFDGRLDKTVFPVESDNEIWFLLALGETAAAGVTASILDLQLPFADGTDATLWEHAKAAWRWVRDVVGVGAHGLVKIWHGDWDDYMSGMGSRGKGESTMNTGMACRALDFCAAIARQRGESVLAVEMEEWTAARRQAMLAAFDQTHFLRGFTDQGKPVGTHAEDRVHLNAQTWAVLGHCGTPEMRRSALQAALRECDSPIGLTIMSRPYPAPPPADISWAPIPAGEGENGGIWPQTVHWAVWALAQEGMAAEAQRVWQAMSLHNHAFLHPEVPYGIWNAPDCYSSRLSHGREGRTQRQILDRFQEGVPMNPAVAWQTFSWMKIIQA